MCVLTICSIYWATVAVFVLCLLCALSSVGEGRDRARTGKGRGLWDDPHPVQQLRPSFSLAPSLSRSPSICSLSETSGGLWNFVFGGLCEKKKTLCKVHLFSLLPFCLFGSFSNPSLSLCCCFLLLCSLIQTSLSCCPFSQRWKDSLTSSKVYGAMYSPLRHSGNRSFQLSND